MTAMTILLLHTRWTKPKLKLVSHKDDRKIFNFKNANWVAYQSETIPTLTNKHQIDQIVENVSTK